jgi:hypothetical protein
MLHPVDPNSGSSQSPTASADGFPFAVVGPTFAVEPPLFATAYAGVPSQTLGAHSWLSPGTAGDCTVGPAVHLVFIVVTAVTIPFFIYRLALRLDRIRHAGVCGLNRRFAAYRRPNLRPPPTEGSPPGKRLDYKAARRFE